MSRILGESLRAYPPTAVTKTTAATTSSAAVAIGGSGFYLFGCEASSNSGLFVLFGTSAVAAASSSNGLKLAPGDSIERYVPPSITHYRVIRAGAADDVFFAAKTGD